MTTKTEGRHAAEGVIFEEEASYSRKVVTIAGGTGGAGILKAMTVLGQLTIGEQYVPSPASGSDGSQTASAINLYPVDATDADVDAVVLVRTARVVADCLSYDASVDTDNEKAAKAAQLEAVGIVVN
jgi:hypothetical protein